MQHTRKHRCPASGLIYEFDCEYDMQRDLLFVLKEKFEDGPGQFFYCPHCAEIMGLLAYFPQLRHQLDVRYVDFPKPRKDLVELIGEPNQNCPI